jgi:hypothetical protein
MERSCTTYQQQRGDEKSQLHDGGHYILNFFQNRKLVEGLEKVSRIENDWYEE